VLDDALAAMDDDDSDSDYIPGDTSSEGTESDDSDDAQAPRPAKRQRRRRSHARIGRIHKQRQAPTAAVRKAVSVAKALAAELTESMDNMPFHSDGARIGKKKSRSGSTPTVSRLSTVSSVRRQSQLQRSSCECPK